jgi:uncharacterized membrane protein
LAGAMHSGLLGSAEVLVLTVSIELVMAKPRANAHLFLNMQSLCIEIVVVLRFYA